MGIGIAVQSTCSTDSVPTGSEDFAETVRIEPIGACVAIEDDDLPVV